jgi:quercetin dioxygenase-like cupin family protein
MTRRWPATVTVGAIALAVMCLTLGHATAAKSATASSVTVKTLAQGPVKSLQAGKIYLSILDFSQLPGADFGPHSHQPSIVYTVRGVDTISFQAGGSQAVGPGSAAFIPGLVVHTHQNADGRIGTDAIAAGLIVLVLLLCSATWLRGAPRRGAIVALSILLVAGGTVPLIRATANDYYLFAVRPEVQRIGAMPRPDARVFFAAPDMDPVPAGPYLETLTEITVPAGASYETPDTKGPQMVVVLEGSAAVHIGDQTTQLSGSGTAFAQMGQTVAIGNQGSGTLKVLEFTVAGGAVS